MFAGKLPRYSHNTTHKKCFNGKGTFIKKLTILSNKHKQIEFKGTTNWCHKLARTNIWEDALAFKQLGNQVEFKGTTNQYVWREFGPSLKCLVISCSQEHCYTYILFVFFITKMPWKNDNGHPVKNKITNLRKNEPKLLYTIQ